MNPMDLADFKFLDKLEASHQAPCSLCYPSKTKDINSGFLDWL